MQGRSRGDLPRLRSPWPCTAFGVRHGFTGGVHPPGLPGEGVLCLPRACLPGEGTDPHRPVGAMGYTLTMPARERVSLYLDRDMWNRLRAAVGQPWIPFSASAIVDTYLAQITPLLEDLNARAEAGDTSGVAEILRGLVLEQVRIGGTALAEVGTTQAGEAGKEDMDDT